MPTKTQNTCGSICWTSPRGQEALSRIRKDICMEQLVDNVGTCIDCEGEDLLLVKCDNRDMCEACQDDYEEEKKE